MPKTAVHCSVAESLKHIEIYLERIRSDLETGDRSQALEHCAEMFELTRRLWAYLAELEGYSCAEAQMKLAAGGAN
jgi:hypothetical protein